jgi:nucleoside-diphosphate-sugar epimerase
MRVTVLGAEGFVGSAFVRHLMRLGIAVKTITRRNYHHERGWYSDIVIDCMGNPRKYISDFDPRSDFWMSVENRFNALYDFPADLRLFISSIDHQDGCNYDVMKRTAENLIAHYAQNYLIVRLSGMVGPGLRKNAVYDIMNCHPIRVHPDSMFSYMLSDDAARIAWKLLVTHGLRKQWINVCGDGYIPLYRIAEFAGKPLDLSLVRLDWKPWDQRVDISPLKNLMSVPSTHATIEAFLHAS